jgi:hypothetical protein
MRCVPARSRLLKLALIAMIVACTDPATPPDQATSETSPTVSMAAAHAFYFFDGEPIPLHIVPDVIIVELENGSQRPIDEVLADVQLTTYSATRLIQMPDHWEVRLGEAVPPKNCGNES